MATLPFGRSYANVMSTLALVVALSGTSYAAIVLERNSVKTKHLAAGAVTSSKVRDGSLKALDFQAGQLPAGAPGADGQDGSPDTPQQVLAKLLGVDGSGSGVDADLLDGAQGSAFQRRGAVTSCAAGDRVTAIAVDGNVTCATDLTAPTGTAGGDLIGTYPNPTIGANAVGANEVADGSLGRADVTVDALTSGTTFNGFVIAANSCRFNVLSNISTAIEANDLVIPRVASGTMPDGVYLQPYVAGADGDLIRILCNGTAADASLSGPYQIAFARQR